MQDKEQQFYTQASHPLLQQNNLKTKGDVKLPQESHCISHRPVQFHCGKSCEHCPRTPHTPVKLPTLQFLHILTPCYTLLFSWLPSLQYQCSPIALLGISPFFLTYTVHTYFVENKQLSGPHAQLQILQQRMFQRL